MISIVISGVVGVVIGYAFRGLIHRQVIKYGQRLKTAALTGEVTLRAEIEAVVKEIKAKL